MTKGSKRRGRGALGFDALEERCLLSHFAGPISPPWGRSDAPCATGPPPSAMVSHPPTGFFDGRPGPPGGGPSFQRGSSPPSVAPPVAEQAPAPAAANNSPAQPAAASSGGAVPALATAAPRPNLPLVGLAAFRPSRPAPVRRHPSFSRPRTGQPTQRQPRPRSVTISSAARKTDQPHRWLRPYRSR